MQPPSEALLQSVMSEAATVRFDDCMAVAAPPKMRALRAAAGSSTPKG